MTSLIDDWEKKVSNIIESMNGYNDPVKDMRLILSQHIFEHRAEKNDHFTHFLFDDTQREPTLYCMSGLTTLAVYPRKGKRVASISLDSQYDTRLTAACLMQGVDGVYVTDNKEVFPIYFYREKRFFDAGNPISLPSFDYLTSIIMQHDGMGRVFWLHNPCCPLSPGSFLQAQILGSCSGGLLHLEFDPERKYDHFIVASSLLAHPFSQGPVNDLKILSTEDTYLALHCSDIEVVVSERDIGFSPDRWHRVTYHSGGAFCLACTPYSLEHRGTFTIAGSKTYVRIKALHYTEGRNSLLPFSKLADSKEKDTALDNMVGLHDLGQSRFTDDYGKDVEVLNVSLDPTMEYRPLPCKLRYSVLNVSLDPTMEYRPLPCKLRYSLICFHGRPMGCYASNGKTLQIWNDLDRHQQKKMKSERMELKKMEVSITSMARVEGRSCYLALGYKDSRVQIFEERGRGTGKLDSIGWITDCHPNSSLRPVTVLRIRAEPFTTGDRLFLFSLVDSSIFIHTILVEAGKMIEVTFILATYHELFDARSFELLEARPFEFAIFGSGIVMHKLTIDERKCLEKYRDFEF
ncbi:hypothetical protein DICVIV_03369 [Dictyocaulus viviparus]|uniref:Uncharacterized protein n=1 Tax=Dictyocaulus viviparus TaxID=29172 RepID=A0A0D8Y3B6_DICVI|nr:hypothetical protein DICVIV_03369 [Dictyocaulus viviparus]